MMLKKLFLSAAVCALVLALTQPASAQGTRVRLRAELQPWEAGPAAGNSNYDERNSIPRKMEVQVQNVREETPFIDVWVVPADFSDFIYVETMELVGGIGRFEHEIEFGQFVPQLFEGDYVLLFDSFTYEVVAYGVYMIDN
jgi:hypothetical protein